MVVLDESDFVKFMFEMSFERISIFQQSPLLFPLTLRY